MKTLFFTSIAILTLVTPTANSADVIPHTIGGMIRGWLTDESITQQPVELNLFSVKIPTKGNVYYLNAQIENVFEKSLCIPTNLFHPSDLLALRAILNVYDSDNQPVPFKYGEPPITWPTNQYVILLPSATAEVTIVLSDYFRFDKNIAPHAASFTFPAFYCDVLGRGYPISDLVSSNTRTLAKIGPLTIVENNEVVVFRGSYLVTSANQ